jgi:hypothetical protein
MLTATFRNEVRRLAGRLYRSDVERLAGERP